MPTYYVEKRMAWGRESWAIIRASDSSVIARCEHPLNAHDIAALLSQNAERAS